MALYRVTIIMNGKKHGASESHVFNRTGTSPGAFASTLVSWLNARAQLLGREFQIDGARVSKIRDDIGLPVKRNVFTFEQVFKPANQTAANAADQPNTAVKVEGTDAPGTHSKQIFFFAPPDDVTIDGGDFVRDRVNFQTNFAAWNTATVGLGAGYLSFAELNELPIDNYTVSAGQIITFTVGGAGFDPGVVGTTMLVRNRGLNNARSVLNRSLRVFVVDVTTAKTVQSIAAGPFLTPGIMTVFDQPSSFVQIAGWSPVKTATHKRGRPLLVSPGRHARRPTT